MQLAAIFSRSAFFPHLATVEIRIKHPPTIKKLAIKNKCTN